MRKLILVIIGFIFFVKIIQFLSNDDAIRQEIANEFKGVIIGDTTFRKNLAPTHFKVKTKDAIIFPLKSKEIEGFYSVGDSIIKPANKNTIFILSKDGQLKEFVFRPRWKENNEK